MATCCLRYGICPSAPRLSSPSFPLPPPHINPQIWHQSLCTSTPPPLIFFSSTPFSLFTSFFSLHLLFLSCFLILLFGFSSILISIPDISCNQCTQEKHTLGVVFLSLCCLCLCICIPPSYILQSAHSRLALAHPGDRMIGCPWHAPTDIVPLSQQFGNSHPAQIQGPCDLPLPCDKDKYTNTQIHIYTNTHTHKYTNTQIHKYMEF